MLPTLIITISYLALEVLVGWLVPLALWAYLYDHGRLYTLGLGPGSWLAAFLLYDLCWYVDHRIGHRVSLFWAFHQVHHSSTNIWGIAQHTRLVGKPTHGLTVPEHSYNPLWTQVAGLSWLAGRLAGASGPAETLAILAGPPDRPLGQPPRVAPAP